MCSLSVFKITRPYWESLGETDDVRHGTGQGENGKKHITLSTSCSKVIPTKYRTSWCICAQNWVLFPLKETTEAMFNTVNTFVKRYCVGDSRCHSAPANNRIRGADLSYNRRYLFGLDIKNLKKPLRIVSF